MREAGYLYILQSDSTAAYYVGSCVVPERRLKEHRNGHVKATAGKGPWRRLALLQFETPAAARQAEHWVKRLRRRQYIESIIAGTFAWPERFGMIARRT